MQTTPLQPLMSSVLPGRSRCGFLLAVITLAVALLHAPGAFADTAPIPSSPDFPWTNPAHQSPLELLISRIASHIAGGPVSVHCESAPGYAAVVAQAGGNASWAGFVAAQWDATTGRSLGVSSVAELASSVCLPLQAFASAAVKPTRCDAGIVAGKRTSGSKTSNRTAALAAVPCFVDGQAAVDMPASFWARYASVAVAIRTLAHESIHLGGVVGGRLPSGLTVGDPQAEARAECGGMQWMPYVAEQLGDTPDDAQAIARYFAATIYPTERATAYWSADCRSGGPLDLHLAGSVWA